MMHMDTGLKMRLVLLLLLKIFWTVALNSTVKQIPECGVHCSEELDPGYPFQVWGNPCSYPVINLISWDYSVNPGSCKKQHTLDNASIIHNVTLSTVVRCEGSKCSLNLNILIILELYDHIRGVYMCVHSAEILGHCQIVTFPRKARRCDTGEKVEIQYDCFSVRPGQDVFVTLRTVPVYCDVLWTRKYTVPECTHDDLRGKVTECITGKLTYTVHPDRREITVMVVEAPEDTGYNLRLCLKGQTCVGTGTFRLIKKKDLHRNESFQYSKLLPCLCIEGWPERTDAHRIQVCPFKNYMEELWSGVSYDHYKQALSWKPMCPVQAVISLCHAVGPGICLDFANMSLPPQRDTVIFSTVDPHPQLCMKFTTEGGSWMRCPFSTEQFPVWDLKVTSKVGQHWVEIMSQFPARFSVGLCEMNSSSGCEPTAGIPFSLISVDEMIPAVINLSAISCGTSTCIQVQRIDVYWTIQELRCNLQCYGEEEPIDQRSDRWSCSWDHKTYIMPVAVCATAFVVAALIGILTKVCWWQSK